MRPSAYDDSAQASALASAGSVNANDYEGYSYDAAGNRTELRKRDGRRIQTAYDALNRVTAKTYPDGGATAVYYAYDNRNLQLYARYSSASGEGVTNGYDGFGRLVSAASNMGGTSRTLTYAWDADGDRVEVKHPDGNYFGTVHDGLDRPFFLHSNWTAGIAYDYYDAAGEVTTSTRVGVEALYSYDALGRLGALIQGSAWGGSVVWQFARNPAGGIASETRDNDAYAWGGHYAVNRGYTTNGLNQYSAAGGVTPTYDSRGNLMSAGSTTYG